MLNKIPIPKNMVILEMLCRGLHLKCRFTVLNREMKFHLHSNINQLIYEGGLIHELRISENLLRLAPNNCVFFDIGCAIGFYSILLSKKCKRIVGFDPYDKSSLLNISLNNISNFELIPCFLSDHKESSNVEIETLDSLIERGLPLPDVVKIDIEGEEYKVLLGAKKKLFDQKSPEVILIETHSEKLFYECLDFLKPFEYIIYNLGCPKVNTGGDIYPMSYDLETDAYSTKSQTRILLALKS
jgi:SAM-dependent methyltransferase